MAESDELRITVSLVDNASAGLASMRRELQGVGQDAGKQLAPLKGAFEGVSKSIKEVTGGHTAAQFEAFKRSQGDMAKVIKEGTDVTMGGEKALLGFIGKFGVAGAAVASLGALATAAAVSNKEWANSLVEMKKQADLLGVDPANLKAMRKYAEEAHVPLEDMTKILRQLPEVAAGLKDPESAMYKRLRELTSDPRYFKSFEKFQEQFEGADDPMKRALVLQNAVRSFGESAANEERQRQQREIAAGRQRVLNEQQINDERVAGQRIGEQALGVPESILLLPKTMAAATEAQKRSMAEAQKAAADVDAQFVKMEESLSKFFSTFEHSISGPVLHAVTQVATATEDLARWYTRAFGSKAEKEAMEEEVFKTKAPGGGSFAVQPVYVKNKEGERLEDVNAKPPPYGYAPEPGAGPTLFKERGSFGGAVPLGARPGEGFMGSPGNVMPSIRDRPTTPMSQQAPPGLGYTPPPGEPTFATFNRDALDSNTEQLKHVNDELSALTQALRPAQPGGATVPLRFTGGGDEDDGLGRYHGFRPSTNVEDVRDPRSMARDSAAWAGGGGLRDHDSTVDQNTEQLKTVNDTLSELTQKLRPLEEGGALQPFQHPVERKAELTLPDPGYVPPFRQAAAAPAEHLIRLAGQPSSQPIEDRGPNNPSILRQHLGQPQFARATDDIDKRADRFGGDRDDAGADPTLRRDDRASELDRKIMDFMKVLRVEGDATLTADIRAPAGTRVGLEGRGLFKKTLLYRQTQMQLASTGPPNPAYSPTLEDFPL